MIEAIGDTIWMALGIALNPVAIVISILIANRPAARRDGVAYVLGWIVGLAVLVAVPTVVLHDRFGLADGVDRGHLARFSLFRAALGVILLCAAVVALVRGPLPGDQPAAPRWARVLDSGGIARAFGMGAFVAIVNLRGLVLLAAAASVIGQANLAYPSLLLGLALFVTIASLGVVIPPLLQLFGGTTATARLRAVAAWLTAHMGLITGVMMALFGALLLTRGVQGAS